MGQMGKVVIIQSVWIIMDLPRENIFQKMLQI